MVGCWEFQINMWFWEGSARLDELKVKGLWMVIDHQALAPLRLFLLYHVSDPLQMYSLFLTSVPWALMLPRCIRRPSVIAHWHLGTWKCFSWVWVTPHTQEGPPASLPPFFFFFCEPDRDMWYVAPCWGGKHWSGWLMLPHFGNSTGLFTLDDGPDV